MIEPVAHRMLTPHHSNITGRSQGTTCGMEVRSGVGSFFEQHSNHRIPVCPDLRLMDLLMPVMDGIAATAAIRRELPETEVLALTSVLEDASVMGAVRAGAIGYLLKDTQAEALCQAIKAAAAGQAQLTPKAAARLMQAVSTPESPEPPTERETDVLRLLAQGQSNKQIARSLHNTEQTIKTHVSKILSKLGVQSRTQATLYAIRVGLGSTRSPDTAR